MKSSWSLIFFGISNFHPKKFGRKNFAPIFFTIFKFRGKNFPAREISRPKRSGRTNVQTKNFWLEKFRTERVESDWPEKFPGTLHIPSEAPPKKGVFSTFAEIVRDFFVRKFVLRIILWREMFCAGKSLGSKPFWKRQSVPAPGIVQVSFAF
ncbi:hypothetical protein [Methanoregula sp.]|jgi:hypothetical protein|uniref:hypothetical protein n=1 Tax=Methanoregula sp. TaxID=2052170 RepID=UPI0035652401